MKTNKSTATNLVGERMLRLTTCSFGAGVQTGTLMEMAVEHKLNGGILPAGINVPDVFIFADTGDEPQQVHDYLAYARRRLASVNIPLITVSNGNMVEDLYSQDSRFAAMPLFTRLLNGRRGKRQKIVPSQAALIDLAQIEIVDEPVEIVGLGGEKAQLISIGKLRRQCTSEYKITPILHEIRVMLLEMRHAREYRNGAIHVHKDSLVETWIGFSLDEWTRMRPSREAWQRKIHPLIDLRMTRHDCIRWLQNRGLPIPPKSACKRCPYHDDAHWLDMKLNRPADFAEVVQFDHDLRDPNSNLRIAATAKAELFVHRSCLPLDQINFQPDEPMPLGCIGHCMT